MLTRCKGEWRVLCASETMCTKALRCKKSRKAWSWAETWPGLQTIMKGFKGVEDGVMIRLAFWKDPAHSACFHRVNHLSLSTHFWDMPGKRMGWTRYGECKVCGEFSVKKHMAPGNRPNGCCQQGREGEKCCGLSRFLWGPLLDSASLVVLTSPWCDIQEWQLGPREGGGGSCVQVAVGNWR